MKKQVDLILSNVKWDSGEFCKKFYFFTEGAKTVEQNKSYESCDLKLCSKPDPDQCISISGKLES